MMKLEPLLKHSQLIPQIAQYLFEEFGKLNPGRTFDDVVSALKTHLQAERLPLTYVLIADDEFVGTFSLRECDMRTRAELGPWLGSLFVCPQYRRRGIGQRLVQEGEALAQRMGLKELYLFTTDKAPWYAKLGWQFFEKTFYNNRPVTIMRKELS